MAHHPGVTGTARIDGATTVFDCLLHALLDGGDHRIVVGEVAAFEHTGDDPPILFFQGAYRTLAPTPQGDA